MAEALPLGHFTSYLIIILVFTAMRICLVDGRDTTSPCPVINNNTGAMLCCPSPVKGIPQPQGEECIKLFPKSSLPLMPESWSKKTYDSTHLSWSQKESLLKPANRSKLCCCKERFDFILPGMAAAANGIPARVMQHSAGYVQPIMAKTCEQTSCSATNRKMKHFSCIQSWTSRELFIEDPLHDGYMHIDRVRVPSGCICSLMSKKDTIPVENRLRQSSSKNVSAKDLEGFQDHVITSLPILTEYDTVSPDTEGSGIKVSGGSSELKGNENYRNHQIPAYLSVTNQNFSNFNNSLELQDLYMPYISSINTQKQLANYSNSNTFQTSSTLLPNGYSNFNGLVDSSPYPSIPSSYYNDISDTNDNPEIQESKSNLHQQPAIVLSEQLENLNNLVSLAQQKFVNPDLTSNMNENLDLLKMIIRSGEMKTHYFMENIFNKLQGDQPKLALAQSMERMMEIETEFHRTSLSILKIIFNNSGPQKSITNGPKFSFADNFNGSDIPLIFKPGDNHPFVTIAPHNTTPIPDISSINESVDIFNVTSVPAREESVLFVTESTPRRLGRVRIEDMLEEQLHSAFANFIFQEAWMNDSCMVPTEINQSYSELYFLPSLIKENFDIQAKGKLNIHKFAGRIIAGIIMCRFENTEAALLDGRFTKAIAVGVKVAELLNNAVEIVEKAMKGLLNTRDAKAITDLLRWSVQSADNPVMTEFLSNNDAMDVDALVNVVNLSLNEYVEFLEAKSSVDRDNQFSPVPAQSSSSVSVNPIRDFGSASIVNRIESVTIESSPDPFRSTFKTEGTSEKPKASPSNSNFVSLLTDPSTQTTVRNHKIVTLQTRPPITPASMTSLTSTTEKHSSTLKNFEISLKPSQNFNMTDMINSTSQAPVVTTEFQMVPAEHESFIPTTNRLRIQLENHGEGHTAVVPEIESLTPETVFPENINGIAETIGVLPSQNGSDGWSSTTPPHHLAINEGNSGEPQLLNATLVTAPSEDYDVAAVITKYDNTYMVYEKVTESILKEIENHMIERTTGNPENIRDTTTSVNDTGTLSEVREIMADTEQDYYDYNIHNGDYEYSVYEYENGEESKLDSYGHTEYKDEEYGTAESNMAHYGNAETHEYGTNESNLNGNIYENTDYDKNETSESNVDYFIYEETNGGDYGYGEWEESDANSPDKSENDKYEELEETEYDHEGSGADQNGNEETSDKYETLVKPETGYENYNGDYYGSYDSISNNNDYEYDDGSDAEILSVADKMFPKDKDLPEEYNPIDINIHLGLLFPSLNK